MESSCAIMKYGVEKRSPSTHLNSSGRRGRIGEERLVGQVSHVVGKSIIVAERSRCMLGEVSIEMFKTASKLTRYLTTALGHQSYLKSRSSPWLYSKHDGICLRLSGPSKPGLGVDVLPSEY
jgi:hypothetical protein